MTTMNISRRCEVAIVVCDEELYLAKVVAALQLVIHHCPILVSSQDQLGTLAVTCKVVKQMLQEQPVAGTDVCLHSLYVSQLAVFSHWLTVYAGMVNSINIQLDDAKASLGCDNTTDQAVADQLLLFGLKESTTASQSPLRLQRFSTNFMHSTAVLGALAGASVKELRLQGLPAIAPQQQTHHALTTAFTVALAGLAKLTFLFLGSDMDNSEAELAMPYAPALARLTDLQRLELMGSLPAEAATHLPCSLEYLTVGLDTPGPVHLSHLTNLENLHLMVYTELAESSTLPPHLTFLQLMSEGRVGNLDLSVLSSLRDLSVDGLVDVVELLLPSCRNWTNLSSLQLLQVQPSNLALLAPVWQQSPHRSGFVG